MTIHETPPPPWIKEVAEELLATAHKDPLFPPPHFSWEILTTSLQSSLQLPKFTLKKQEVHWRSSEEIREGLGEDFQTLTLSLSPLEGTLYWCMGQQNIQKITQWLMSYKEEQLPAPDAAITQGYYLFLAAHTLRSLDQLQCLPEVTPQLGDEQPLPIETCFCLDVSITHNGQSVWGRLCFDETLRQAWNQHVQKSPAFLAQRSHAAHLEIPVSISVGEVFLPQKDLSDLKPGDFLLLDRCSWNLETKEGHASLEISGKQIATAHLSSQGTLTLDTQVEEPSR